MVYLKEIKTVIYMTVFIIIFMLLAACLLIKINPFNENGQAIYYNADGKIDLQGDNYVKLYNIKDKKVEKIELEEYVKGVVASEMPVSFDEKALEAQAVAARTYYIAKRIDPCSQAIKGEICNTTHCQVYTTKEENLNKWAPSEAQKNWDKICDAVEKTKGQVLVYNGEVIKYPQFFATSSGKTESSVDVFARDVPYLKSTDSEGEEIAPKYTSSVKLSISSFVNAINEKYKNAKVTNQNAKEKVKINSNTEGGAVKEIILGDEKIDGTSFRKLFNLNSTNFTLSFSDKDVEINCKGYGHGVGMSQWGANVMAKQGKTYDEILKHYYSGVEIWEIRFKF